MRVRSRSCAAAMSGRRNATIRSAFLMPPLSQTTLSAALHSPPAPERRRWARAGGAKRRRETRSVSLVRQELPGHLDMHAVALLVGLARDVHVEVDRAHDAVA